MLRNRILSAYSSTVEVTTHFFSIDGKTSAVCVRYSDRGFSADPVLVSDHPKDDDGHLLSPLQFLPLPSIEDIKVEIDYLFHILNTLQPYETQTQVPQDLPPVSDQSRRDPLLDDDEDFFF